MCDYSLEQVQSRDAVVADRLVTTSFPNTLTRGFADVNARENEKTENLDGSGEAATGEVGAWWGPHA